MLRKTKVYKLTSKYILLFLLSFVISCKSKNQGIYQGYAEGEFVFISSPSAGKLISLKVKRGEEVKKGQLLFILDDTTEKLSVEEAQKRFVQAKATLDDISKGRRPSEINAIKTQIKQAQTQLELSEKSYNRILKLSEARAKSEQEVDEAKAKRDIDQQKVQQLNSELETAVLGARVDQIKFAQEEVDAKKAYLDRAKWQLEEKSQNAPEDALVFDTLFQTGEWIPTGQAVVSLLPANNIKIKTFVPESFLTNIHQGQEVKIHRDGESTPLTGKISYISTQSEYTPPVIYSRENRAKLVYLVEIRVEPEYANQLHPGQPLDVEFGVQ